MVLKHGVSADYSFFDKSELITKGTWPQRIGNYQKIFKSVPQTLASSVSDLEKMRKIRNNVAHAFGRDIEKTRARETIEILPIERLSEIRLQKYMEIIRKISKEIDNQLLTNHIGEFELIHFYHRIKSELRIDHKIQDLKTKTNSLNVELRNHTFYKELIEYYDQI